VQFRRIQQGKRAIDSRIRVFAYRQEFGVPGSAVDATTAEENDTLGTTRQWRPWGVAGDHLRRSNVARYNDQVVACRTLDAVRAVVQGRACEAAGGKAVIKEEFSSSVRVLLYLVAHLLLV
jgi:hypothetical protein